MPRKIIPINEKFSTVPVLESTREVRYRQSIIVDNNGEIISESFRRQSSQNGSGFVISYTEKICELLSKVKTGSVLRVFFYIAHHQSYGNSGTFGYRCSHKYLQQVLSIDKSTLWDALKVLKDSFLVHETRIDGQVEFMVNPTYITVGSDKKARMREWNRRWEDHWKKVHSQK